MPSGSTATTRWAHRCVVATALGASSLAWAAGTGENAVLVVDPANAESLYIANYYRDARGIPPGNVIYMEPSAVNFPNFADDQLAGFLGSLSNFGIEDHVDYVVVPPGGPYRIGANGLISDTCATVSRFSASSIFTMAHIADEVLSATLPVTTANRYHTAGTSAIAFDSSTGWLNGSPSALGSARRYFIGAMLGYTGKRGNTLQEIIDMIDRSVAVDGTLPGGTFYYMQTEDQARSEPRHGFYPAAVATITGLGGMAEHLSIVPSDDLNVMPTAGDVLGVMTGWATPDILGSPMTLLPGAFCDHLTSFAGHFDTASQTKMSEWITRGASGSWGAVQEPCNYAGKFPTANMHAFYLQGLTLGEAAFRSSEYVPFQMLLYGDPLTRPHTYIPSVSPPAMPIGPASGTIVIVPAATTAHPTAQIDGYELLIDGLLADSATAGGSFSLDTTMLADGHHDLRVLAFDDTTVKAVGRWAGSLVVDNFGRSASATPSATSGTPATAFGFDLSASGGAVEEIRLMQGSRVVGSTSSSPQSITLYGRNLGAGPVTLFAEATFDDGRTARSAPIELDITFDTAAAPGAAPVAFDYTRKVRRDVAAIIELPAAHNHEYADVSYSIIGSPSQATVQAVPGSYAIIVPDSDAIGTDTMSFEVSATTGTSTADVTLVYGGPVFNDDCSSATLIMVGDSVFTTIDATTDGFDESAACLFEGDGDVQNDIWFRHFAPCAGQLTLSLSDLTYDAKVAIYQTFSCPAGPNEAIACIQAPGQTSVTLAVTAGESLRIRVGGLDGAKGNGTLTLACNACPADCAGGGDGVVDVVDLLELLAAWGGGGGGCDFAGGDPDGPDGVVDVVDLLALLGAWGDCP